MRASAATALQFALVAAVRGQSSTNPLTCKQNFKLFMGSSFGMTLSRHGPPDGCYKVFPTATNWTVARAYCESDDVNGSLAASRHGSEQDFLVNQMTKYSWGAQFWMSGNSLSASKLYKWQWGDAFQKSVDFNSNNWQTQMIDVLPVSSGTVAPVDDEQAYPSHVLINGYRGAYKWKATTNTSHLLPFICWKKACVAGEDVAGGLCTNEAASVQPGPSETDWAWLYITSAVIIVVVSITTSLIWLYYYHNDLWVDLVYFVTCRDDSDEIMLAEIPDEWRKNFRAKAFAVKMGVDNRGSLDLQANQRALAMGGTGFAAAAGAFTMAGEEHNAAMDTLTRVRRASIAHQEHARDSHSDFHIDVDPVEEAAQRARMVARLPQIKERAPENPSSPGRDSVQSKVSLPPMAASAASAGNDDPFSALESGERAGARAGRPSQGSRPPGGSLRGRGGRAGSLRGRGGRGRGGRRPPPPQGMGSVDAGSAPRSSMPGTRMPRGRGQGSLRGRGRGMPRGRGSRKVAPSPGVSSA